MYHEIIAITTVLVPLTCAAIAAWPILCLPRIRPFLARAGGSSCICLGATIVGLLTSGVLPAVADDKPAETKASKQTVAADAKPTETKSDDKKSGAAEADPQIDAPADTVEIPPGRPSWVGAEPNTREKIHTVAVSSGPYKKEGQAKRALDEAIEKATSDYIADQLGSEYAPLALRYDASTIKKRYLKDANRYQDVARYSEPVGEMHEHFVLLEFGPDFRKELDRRWTQVRATSRVLQTGLLSGAALLLLSSVYGYFRLDNATRGYYTSRLQFMTAAAILAVVGMGAVIARYITWL